MLEVELGVVEVEGVVVVVTVVAVVVVGVVGMVVSGIGVVVAGVVVGVVVVVVLSVVVVVVLVVIVVVVSESVVVSEGVVVVVLVVVGLLGSSPGPSQELVNSLGDVGSEETSAVADWQISETSYFTNTHPGTARHGSQSNVGLQSGVEGVVVVAALEGVGLDGVVLGGVEGESVGKAIVWHPRARQTRKYPSMMVVRLSLSLSISDHYQIALVWSGLKISGSELCE